MADQPNQIVVKKACEIADLMREEGIHQDLSAFELAVLVKQYAEWELTGHVINLHTGEILDVDPNAPISYPVVAPLLSEGE